MPDEEITREKTFSEELPHFKERIEEVFDNYNNPNGNEDPLYINVLRDSKRIVRKAEKEITYQQADIRMLRKKVNLVSIQFQDLQERYEETQTEIEQWKEEANKYQNLWCTAIDDIKTAKSKAIQEFVEKLKDAAMSYLRGGKYYKIITTRCIDTLLKEMVGEEE